MDLTSAKTIKELLYEYDARASKGLGQNFLVDKNTLQKIVDAADLKSTDVVLEIGPGIGTLTKELAQRVKKVIAIEKDRKMLGILQKTLKEFKNVEIISGDALKTDFSFLKEYKIVANLPYYIASPVIRRFLEIEKQPEMMILMVQKEVGQRICAKPPDMSLLAVSVQFYADPKIISYVSNGCFWPSPKVDSAIIKIVPKKRLEEVSPDLFFKVVKAGFSHKRKQLVNNLTTLKLTNGVKLDKDKISSWLLENNTKPNQRAETISVADWIGLVKSFFEINN